MDTKVSFPGVKRPRRKADHSPPSSAEIKNAWRNTSVSLRRDAYLRTGRTVPSGFEVQKCSY